MNYFDDENEFDDDDNIENEFDDFDDDDYLEYNQSIMYGCPCPMCNSSENDW